VTINLPPDPNDTPKTAAAPVFPPPAGAPLGGVPLPGQPVNGQPTPPRAPAAPAFPDGSRGAAYRQPYVVTRRNNSRKWMILGAVGFTVALVLGIVLFLVVGLPLMFARP
jgi:hypothetical protein